MSVLKRIREGRCEVRISEGYGTRGYRLHSMDSGRTLLDMFITRSGERIPHDLPKRIVKYTLADGADLRTFAREGR